MTSAKMTRSLMLNLMRSNYNKMRTAMELIGTLSVLVGEPVAGVLLDQLQILVLLMTGTHVVQSN